MIIFRPTSTKPQAECKWLQRHFIRWS